MDPLNDLVWTDEDDSDILPVAVDGPPMPQICTVSDSSCSDDGGNCGTSYSGGLYVAGNFVYDLACGC